MKYMQKIHPSCFIAEGARVIGNVTLAESVSIWYNAVLRADIGEIFIGKNSNIQDCCVLHAEPGGMTKIGENVTVGHSAIVHGATVGDSTLIGMHATVLNDVEIGEGSVIGAHALITENTKIPPNSLVLGVPGKIVRTKIDRTDLIKASAEVYAGLAEEHKEGKYELYHGNKR